MARFSARKRSAPPEGNICAGHFIRSSSTKESRDGFVNSFHTRPSPIHRGIASRASCAPRGLVDGGGFSRVDGICPVSGCRELVALFSCIIEGKVREFFFKFDSVLRKLRISFFSFFFVCDKIGGKNFFPSSRNRIFCARHTIQRRSINHSSF